MTIRWGDTGKVVAGTYKEINIQIGKNENQLETPVLLPTSRPNEPVVTFTITEELLPSVTDQFGLQMGASEYMIRPFLHISGKNNDLTTKTISVEYSKNGVVIFTSGNNITSGSTWTSNYISYTGGVSLGDIFEIRAWANGEFVNHSWNCMFTIPHMFPYKSGRILKDFYFEVTTPVTTVTSGVSWTGNCYIYPYDDTTGFAIDGNRTMTVYSPTSYLYQLQATINSINSSSNGSITRTSNRYPTKITFREFFK